MPHITVIEKAPLSPSESITTEVNTVEGRLSRLTFESIDSGVVVDDDTIDSVDEDVLQQKTLESSNGVFPPKLYKEVSLLTKVFEDSDEDMIKLRREEEHRRLQEEEHRRLWGDDDLEEKQRLMNKKKEMKKSTKSDALLFVKQEEKRIKAMHWLSDKGRQAVLTCNKDAAFDYLVTRVTDAKVKTAHLTMSLRASANSFSVPARDGGRRQSILKRSDLSRSSINNRKYGLPDSLLSSRDSVRRSARQSNSKRLPPNEIAVKRNDLLTKRRQSIIDNKMQRSQFGTPAIAGGTSAATEDVKRTRVASMTSFHEDDEGSRSSGASERMNIVPIITSNKKVGSPVLSSSPSSRSSNRGTTAPNSPPFSWAQEFESEYFKGNSTDPGFFPPTALESAAYLVAALHGKSDMVLNCGNYKRDAKTPAVETLLHSSEQALINNRPDAYVHPINANILLNMQNKITQNKIAARQAMKKKFFKSSSKGIYVHTFIHTYIYIFTHVCMQM